MPTNRGRRGIALGLVFSGLVAAGCGGSGSSTGSTVASGQIAGSDLPSNAAGAKSSSATVPLAKQNPITTLFSSISTFQSCLTGLGVTFIGAPDPSDPSSGTNNPAYIKSLATCAAKSNILQSLKAEQTAQDNLTQAQIKTENQEYLVFRKCMIARGWGIPAPKPNADGLLFSFGGATGSATGGDATQFKPPPGQSLLSSSDLQACAGKALPGG